MRGRITLATSLTFATALALVWACGGGGGSSTASSTPPDLTTFNGCPPEGSAVSSEVQALNRLKSRYLDPASPTPTITLAALTTPGDDTARWSPDQGAEFTGYVVRAFAAGSGESANCGATTPDKMDIHIELVADPAQTDPTKRVIVEITPRTRFLASLRGENWSADVLPGAIRNKWVKVRGWMLFDTEHANESLNTAPSNTADWRATAWEVHPVTRLQVVNGP